MKNVFENLRVISIDENIMKLHYLLKNDKNIRSESHDWFNIAIASLYNLKLLTYDEDLIRDQLSINKVLEKNDYRKIKIIKISEL